MSRTEFKLDELYKTYAPMVLRRCRALLKNSAAAEDIMQNVFFKVAKKQDELDMKYPSSLLYRIATNLCLNYIRDNKRFVSESAGSQEESLLVHIATVDSSENQSGAKMLLNKLFAKNLETTKLIAMLHYHDGFTLEETAKEVGLSVSGVRKRLRNLRSDLKNMEESC